MRKSILTIVLSAFCMSTIQSQDCECNISEVLANTVAPCTEIIGTVVNVKTSSEFRNAIRTANSTGGNMTILIADGTYQVASSSGYPYITASNMVIRSASGNRDAVILTGSGMYSSSHVEIGLYLVGDNITVADLTIRSVTNHAIATNSDNHLIHNVRIQDSYEQMIKGNQSPSGSNNGVVQCSLFEYTAGVGPQFYIGGLDIHQGINWTVSDNVFYDIASPSRAVAEHAIHFWNFSEDNVIERNMIVNCDRGIGFGLGSSPNQGGIIRNNTIYNSGSGLFSDVGIGLETSPNTKVYNNTINIEYPNAIEYRFAATTGVEIANNLSNRAIKVRNGAVANVYNNIENATAAYYVNLSIGDLHLTSAASAAIDQGVDLGNDVTMDFDKNPRVSGSYDIGADEYGNNDDPEEETPTAGSLPLIQIDDLEYKGGFTIPSQVFGESNANYATGTIAYNPNNQSLFLAGFSPDGSIAEFAIPTLINSTNLLELKTATILQNFRKFLNQTPDNNPQSLDVITGMKLLNNKLVVNLIEKYDASGTKNTHTTLILENASDIANTSVSGYYSLNGAAHAAGYISEIPTEWQTLLEGDYISGNSSRYSINSRLPMGPTAFVLNSSDLNTAAANTPIPTTALLDFDLANPLYAEYNSYFDANYNIVSLNGSTFPGHTFADAEATVGTNDLWTERSEANYGFIVPGTSTYLTIGVGSGHNSGIGYKPTQSDGYQCQGGCSYDADDSDNYYWLWDVNDFLKVKNGTLNPHDLRPYSYGIIEMPFQTDVPSNSPEFHPISGGTYDAASGILYLSLFDGAPITNPYARTPVIVAYQINATDEDTDPGESTTFVVRARGVDGTEQMSLLLNDEVVETWTVTTTDFSNYTYTGDYNKENLKVAFVNDAQQRDLYIDYVDVGEERKQAEQQTENTAAWQAGVCGAGTLTEALHCSGYINFNSFTTFKGGTNLKSVLKKGLFDGVSISPNPIGDGYLTITKLPVQDQEITIKVLSSSGNVVLIEKLIQTDQHKLDMSSLSAGLYFVIFESGTTRTARKIIKSK